MNKSGTAVTSCVTHEWVWLHELWISESVSLKFVEGHISETLSQNLAHTCSLHAKVVDGFYLV